MIYGRLRTMARGTTGFPISAFDFFDRQRADKAKSVTLDPDQQEKLMGSTRKIAKLDSFCRATTGKPLMDYPNGTDQFIKDLQNGELKQ